METGPAVGALAATRSASTGESSLPFSFCSMHCPTNKLHHFFRIASSMGTSSCSIGC
jgi:hypothetical protein